MRFAFLLLCLVVVVRGRVTIDAKMPGMGLECVWGEWTVDEVAGWTMSGTHPHHLILYATTSPPTDGCPDKPENLELVYVWGGESRFEYGERTVRKITPGTRYYLEVHNHGTKPLKVRVESFESVQVPKWQAWILVSALRSGRVREGETKTLVTPDCKPEGEIKRLRMHSHDAIRTELIVANQSAIDTKRDDRVNQWYEAAGWGTGSIRAECTFAHDCAIGFTWCNGCAREMCNAFAQIQAPIDATLSTTQCVGPPQ